MPMKLKTLAPLTLASIFSVLIVAGAIGFSLNQRRNPPVVFDENTVLPPPITQPPSSAKVVSAKELELSNGKNGRPCFVVVDGIVYEIVQGRLWNDGQHDTSNNQAYCGADMTEALRQSPHGASKLTGLPQIGKYQP